MTTSPSWLPALVRYTARGWERYADVYRGLIPGTFSRHLWGEGSEVEADHTALGECLGHVRDLYRWVLECIIPERDSEALFLDRYEADYGLIARATTAERAAWITAFARIGGTTRRALIKAAFSQCWDGSASSVTLAWGDPSTIPANNTLGDQTGATDQNTMLIYHSDEDTQPDYDLGDALIDLLQPVGELWMINMDRYPLCGADTAICGRFLCGS